MNDEFVRGTVRHGTSAGYTYGCRCDECRRARNEQKADWRRRNFRKAQAHSAKTRTAHQRGTANAAHGTRSRYNMGCRCDDCRAASTAYARRRREQAS